MADFNAPTAHRIVIRPETWGDRTDVVIEPPLVGENIARDFDVPSAARAYAVELSARTGLDITDETAAGVAEDGAS